MTAIGNKPPRPTAARDILVIGGSTGALDPMIQLASALPENYPGFLFIVSHIGANPSHLPELLARASRLPAAHARHDEPLEPGRIYVAPPDRHMLVTERRVLLSAQPREHFTRPAIDPLFRSAARAFGDRVVGIVLSGSGSDGALGLQAVQRAGGITVVQDPSDAISRQMPEAALRAVAADYVVDATALAALIPGLEQAVATAPPKPAVEVRSGEDLSTPVALTCPECGGAVREVVGGELLSYACHTGHRFSADELLAHQRNDVERAVMVAIRVLQERVALCRRMGSDAARGGRHHGVAYWQRVAREAEDQLNVLQQFQRSPEAGTAAHDGDAHPAALPVPEPAK
ncbi:MAG TPA: chemotaxis protein CheB [Stellaceae bacterium]|nr:chemotaxis protein CheB [Stellaceae bacterium]